ncbi:TerD family protein [Clostridium butyricum]|uniref:TerD family protein n=1 Tax=Clostridium butyricum TaxID=1492 RepID=UPI0023306340|nr:TerD family protein [Clostridium butyricum]MDB2162416.1 TerD family protein [Clostridium butyricum]
MAVSLQKRQGISLKKDNGTKLTKITLGLSWCEKKKGRTVTETVPKKGLFNRLIGAVEEVTRTIPVNTKDVDLDTAVLAYKRNDYKGICYFGDKDMYIRNNHIIHHYGDALSSNTKFTEKDNEQIDIYLDKIDTNIMDTFYLVMNIFTSGIDFGDIENARVTVYDEKGNSIATYNPVDDYRGNNGIIVGKVYHNGSEWKFEAIGDGKNVSRLIDFKRYL